MSDLTPDPTDDRLRAALAAEAEGVTAGPELLARIQATAAATPPSRRIAPWLLVAAVSALVVGLVATLLSDDGGQKVNTANDPTSTTEGPPARDPYDLLATAFGCETDGFQTVYLLALDATLAQGDVVAAALDADPRMQSVRPVTTDEVAALLAAAAPGETWDPAEIPVGYLTTARTEEDDLGVRGVVSDLPGMESISSTNCTEATTTAERPSLIALVREDGMLVTVDLATGEETELYTAGDPREEVEGGAYSIDSVELSPDFEWIYFSTCCEPAVGTTFRIPVTGGEPEQVGYGAYPRVSPDGRFVATAGSESVFVFDASAPGSEPLATLDVPCCSSRLAWSPDGTRLALVNGTGAPGELREVLAFAWDGAALTPSDLGKPETLGSFVSWMPDGTPVTSSGGPIDDERSLSLDGSYTWLLWVGEEGVVREQDGHESGDRLPIAGLPEALAADW